MNVFVLDEVTYELDSLPEQAKSIYATIERIQEKQKFENIIFESALQMHIQALSSMKDQFVSVKSEEE